MNQPPGPCDPEFLRELGRSLDGVAETLRIEEFGQTLDRDLGELRRDFGALAARLSRIPMQPRPRPLTVRRGLRRKEEDAPAELETALVLHAGAAPCLEELFADLDEAVQIGEWSVRRLSAPDRASSALSFRRTGHEVERSSPHAMEVRLTPEADRSWQVEVQGPSANQLRLHDGREEQAPLAGVHSDRATFRWRPQPGDRLQILDCGAEPASWTLPILVDES